MVDLEHAPFSPLPLRSGGGGHIGTLEVALSTLAVWNQSAPRIQAGQGRAGHRRATIFGGAGTPAPPFCLLPLGPQISPLERNVSESICSLKFAQRVCKVELGPASRHITSPAQREV